MPQFRKLHTKIIDSMDVDAMSSDFVRLTWSWLQLIACKEGRGMMHGGWLKSKLYPLRDDVTPQMLVDAMHEFHELGMVTLYSSGRRDYFQINKWHEYQSTSREGKTSYPAPTQELVMSYSGVSQDELERTSSSLILSSLILENDEKSEIITALCNVCANAGAADRKTLDAADDIIEAGRTAEWVTGFGEWYAKFGDGRPYLKHLQTFGGHYDRKEVPHFAKKKNGAGNFDALLQVIVAGQRAGLSFKDFEASAKDAGVYDYWRALGMKWTDVKRLSEKQTAALRFKVAQGVA